jgi:ABC-type multidrug transport system ATPase subunit/ABC-type transporter Mla maintaining outer membrane lipid asymmetry permease subunit MlaE
VSSSPREPASVISFSDFRLAHRRAGRDLVVVENVDLEIPHGGFYLLVGESGSGKSTLLRFLTGLWEPREPAPKFSGRVEVLGQRVRGSYPTSLRRRVAAVLQDEGLLDEMSPRRNVELALRTANRSPKIALGLLSQAGLDKPPASVSMLSGGMRKRVAVARAMALDPELIVFDEPTAGLDPESAREIARLLRETHDRSKDSRTTLVISHDLEAFEDLADRILELDGEHKSLFFSDTERVHADAERWVQKPSDGSFDEDPALYGIRQVLFALAAQTNTFVEALYRLPPVYLGVVLRTTGRYLVEPAVFTVLVSVTIGGLATFFSLQNNPLESAFTSQLLTGVGKVLVAVLVPLMAGFFFTARMAAGAAARIGTMKRTHQVAALQLMGVRPSDYLLTPLVWAMCIAMPVVTAAGIVAASLSSFFVYKLLTGASTYGWIASFFRTVDRADMRFVLLKTVLSGFLIAAVTYHLAVGPKRSGRDVGNAVNSCIVLGMVIVLIVHSGLTILQFPSGPGP